MTADLALIDVLSAMGQTELASHLLASDYDTDEDALEGGEDTP